MDCTNVVIARRRHHYNNYHRVNYFIVVVFGVAAMMLMMMMIPLSTTIFLDDNFPGRSWQKKLTDMRAEMAAKDVDLLVITSLDETACKFLVCSIIMCLIYWLMLLGCTPLQQSFSYI